MAYILSLETSSSVCSVALHQDGQLLTYAELRLEKSHSSHITMMVNQVLEYAGVSLRQVDAVAVSGGPGSYTGLRIGSGTAKGLCFSLNIPLIAVDTLMAMAQQVIDLAAYKEKYLFCPMIDARRSEVYTCLVTHDHQVALPVEPLIIEPTSFESYLQEQPIIFLGNGATKAKELLVPHQNAFFLESVKPSAKEVGALAFAKLEAKQFEDVAYYEPFYLKEVYITKPTAK